MIQMLAEDLKKDGYTVLITKQPTDEIRKTEMFRKFHDSPEYEKYDYRALSLMCAADRLQHINEVIAPALARGDAVLCDRYYYSCLANLRTRGFCEDGWIYEISRNVTEPDIAFFFDVPVVEAVRRVRQREAERDRYIDMQLELRLRDEYVDICRANGGVSVSTDRAPKESYREVKQAVEKALRTKIKKEGEKKK